MTSEGKNLVAWYEFALPFGVNVMLNISYNKTKYSKMTETRPTT